MRTALTVLAAVAALEAGQPRLADLAIRDVRVVHGNGRVTPRASVLVSGGRIVAILRGESAGWRSRREIDGRGRTLVPGLIDAHVTVSPAALSSLLAAGVTSVRDLHNDPAYVLPLAEEDSPGRPRIVAAGAALDGVDSAVAGALRVATLGEARAAIRRQVGAGAGVVAVHARLAPALLSAVVREARARNVPVAVHAGRATAVDAAAAGAASLEHASGIVEAAAEATARTPLVASPASDELRPLARAWRSVRETRVDEVLRSLRARGVTIVPTLAAFEALSRLDEPAAERGHNASDAPSVARALPLLVRAVAAYARAGGRVVAGSGAPAPFLVPGAGLHRELQLLVAAGMSPAAALRAATLDAADLLGIADRTGSIDVGKDADLVLLDADPLRDITATRRIRLVVRGGMVVATD